MKLSLLSAWALCVFAGSLLAAPAMLAQPTASAYADTLDPTIPTGLAAKGSIAPVGSNVRLYWHTVPGATSYKVYRDGQPLAGSPLARFLDYRVAGGETHLYTVSSLGAFGESAQSAPAKAGVPAGGGTVIFSNTLQNDWASWGWASLNYSNFAPSQTGHSVRVAAGPWQAMYLHHAPLSTANFAALTFSVNGGQAGGQLLTVCALRSGVAQPPVPLNPLPANAWRQITIPLSALGVGGVGDLDGLWIQDATGTAQPKFYVDAIALTSGVSLPPPPAPAGLTATPQWVLNCPTCNMAMSHIVLAWQTVSGAQSYTVYRDGVALVAGITAPADTDMDVTSGQSYSYTVSSTGPGGEGPRSAAVSAIAPSAPSGTLLTPPANISVAPLWQGATANVLSWQAVPGAAAYNVYSSDVLVGSGLTGTTYTVAPSAMWEGAVFTVTSVDGTGAESIPSAPAGDLGAYDPSNPPSWTNYVPDTPDTLTAVPDWNGGGPRINLSWRGRGTNRVYNVYRDGTKVASGLFAAYYLDSTVQPGETHSYCVTGVNTDWPAQIEGTASAAVTATALETPPAAITAKIAITKIVPNDDSAVVFFTPIPGATDYRIYDVSNPAKMKYAGNLTLQQTDAGLATRTPIGIEWNGIDPTTGADLIVEAVDKFGPFQRMDGTTGSGVMNMNSMDGDAVNGQGDPSNSPAVLTQSDPFHVTCAPVTLTGDQVFFDNFRGSKPFTPLGMPSVIPPGSNFYGHPGDYAAYANDKWEIREYGADITNSQIFAMGNHFMDTIYDGGGPTSSNGPHNNNASMVMVPNATADISGGKVLHVTFEVDAHTDTRRWCELMIGEAGDTLINVAKFDQTGGKPTVSGKLLRWQIENGADQMQVFLGDDNTRGVDLMQFSSFADSVTCARLMWDHVGPYANGTDQDLDKRHRFDLYLSKTHYKMMETTPDGLYNIVREKDFPAGVSLPFDKCQVYLVHQVYHTGNDRPELMEWAPYESYWYNFRPYSDERHWDNIGFEVLSSFPSP